MFLNELKKDEAIAFLELVNQVANVDEVFAKEEKNLIEDYKKELNLPEYEIQNMKYDEIIEKLSKSTERTKRIIYFEIVGLALIDGEYEEREVGLLEKIEKDLGVERARRIAIANYFFMFTEVYNFSVVDAESKIDLLREQAEAILA